MSIGGFMAGLARKLRVLFAGAIYHVMFRGNARQRIFHGDGDRERILRCLAATRIRWTFTSIA